MACICFRHENQGLGSSRADRMEFAEPGVGPHYGPDRTVAIEHLHLKLAIDPAACTFVGSATLRFKRLPLHKGTLSLNLDEVVVENVQYEDGSPLRWRHADGRLDIRGVETDQPIVVRWHGENPRRGMYFTGPTETEPDRQRMAWTQCQDEDAHFLVPCQDHPGIKHPWTIELEGPLGYTLLSNGERMESGERDGRSFAKFEQREPMPAYLLTAVCAKLSVFTDQWRDRPVRYLVPVGEEEAVQRSMGKTPAMIELFSQLTGVDFPWPRYDQVVVHDFVFGGMENTACTTMTRLLLVDEKAALEWDPDSLVAHELAHQWFGDLVTCQDWSQGWLNESWATFMEIVWYEHDRPAAEATWYRWEQARAYFGEESSRYRRPIVSYDFREPIDVFDRHLYEKGGCVLAQLRDQLGGEAFWAGVKHYLQRHGHQTVHTRHFQRAMEEATGKNLDRYFHQWVHSPGHPVLEVGASREDDLIVVSVKQTQTGENVPEVFHFALKVIVVGADGSEHPVELQVRERERTWAIPFAGDVATVRIDPGARVLAQIGLKMSRSWLETLVNDPCPVLAVRAAEALVEEGSGAAFRTLTAALAAHPFHGVRGAIAGLLGKRGGKDAQQVLIAAHATETDPRAKRGIAEALGSFRDPDVATALIAALDAPLETWHHYGALLLSLGKTRDSRAESVITARMQREGWADLVRQRGLEGLAELEQESALDTLVSHTRPNHRARVRAAAARGLGRLGTRVEKTRRKAGERLIEMLVEPGFRPQLGAIAALAKLKDARAIDGLQQVHQSAPDGRTRRDAYEAMVRIRSGKTTDDAVNQLQKRLDALTEENSKLRQRVEKLEKVESN